MIPINVAITGHRDLKEDKTPEYKDTIKKILQDLRMKYPNTEIQVLTGMAEGSDILGAKAALEAGCSLIAVLPMEQSEFVKTFYSDNMEQSVSEFKNIIKKASKVIDLSEIYKDRKNPDDAYVQLGVYLTENSQRIIALWNGVCNDKQGGTSSVISYALNGMPRMYRKKYSIIDNDDTIPVHYIPVERITKEEGEQNLDCKVKVEENQNILYPIAWGDADVDDIEGYYSNILVEIDAFNEQYSKNADEITGDNQDDNEGQSEGKKELTRMQRAADVVAGKYQKKTMCFLKLQLISGFLVFFWVSLFDEILPKYPYILYFSPIFFLICVFIFLHVKRRNIENRYYDYRALGECLRVQYYWKSVGINENTNSFYSRKNEWELGWVLAAVQNVSLNVNYELYENEPIEPDYQKLKEDWLDNQFAYYKSKCVKNRNKIANNKKVTYFFFGAGFIFVILLIIDSMYINYPDGYESVLQHIFLFLIDVCLAIGAVFSGYLEKRQYDTEISQYTRMVMLLNQGIKEFELMLKEEDKQSIERTIKEIGGDMLAENADWVVCNRMSTIGIPMG